MAVVGEPVLRKFRDFARNVGANPPVSVEYSSDLDAWDLAAVDKADAAHTQVSKSLLLVAPHDAAYATVQSGSPLEHVAPHCQAGDYFYGIGITSNKIYRRAVSADSNTAWELRYTPGTTFEGLWGLPSGRVLAFRDPSASVYQSTDGGTTWSVVIGLWSGADPLKCSNANSRIAAWSFANAGNVATIAEYATGAGGYRVWLTLDGITWLQIYDHLSPPGGFTPPAGFTHFHGPALVGNYGLYPYGDTGQGMLRYNLTTQTWTELYGSSSGAQMLKVSPAAGRTDIAICAADGAFQLGVVDVETGALTQTFSGWASTTTASKPPYTYAVFYADGLYYASNWLNGSANCRIMSGLICAQSPYGPWTLVSWLLNTMGVYALVGKTGDGKLMFRIMQYESTPREAWYMTPVAARAVDALTLEGARTDLQGEHYSNFGGSIPAREFHYSFATLISVTTDVGTTGTTLVATEVSTDFAPSHVGDYAWFEATGNSYRIVTFTDYRTVQLATALAPADEGAGKSVRVRDGQYGVADLNVSATGGVGDNGGQTVIMTGPSIPSIQLRILPGASGIAATVGVAYQVSCWARPTIDCLLALYAARATTKQAAGVQTVWCKAGTHTLLRSGSILAVSSGDTLKLGLVAATNAGYDDGLLSVELSRVTVTRAPAHSPLQVDDTLVAHARDGKFDVGAYWSHLFHFAAHQSSVRWSGEAHNQGLGFNQKCYLASWENGTNYARLYWRGGQQAKIAAITKNVPSAPYATIVVDASSPSAFVNPAGATDAAAVGHWITLIDNIIDPTAGGTAWLRYRVYSVTNGTTIVVEDPADTCDTTHHPVGAYLWLDQPRLCLDVHDAAHDETLWCGGTTAVPMDLLGGSPIGIVICLGNNAGDAATVRAFVHNGGAVQQMTRDGSAAGTLNTYTLGNVRLTARFANPADTDEGLPGYLVEGGMFAHQSDADATALLSNLLMHAAGGGDLWW